MPIRICCLAMLMMWLVCGPAWALRCYSDLVLEGDSKFEVIKKCGEPVSVEFIGYKLDAHGRRDLLIEHLYFGPWKGYFYVIEVIGGRVHKIESFRG